MAFKGMNPDEGREVGSAVVEAGGRVLEIVDAVSGVVNSVEWVGPDYDAYREEWNAFLSGPVSNLQDAYKTKGDELTQHADEQDSTSNSQ